MPFRYTLRLADGSDAGEVVLGQSPNPGDVIRISGNRLMLVRAVIPLERVEEFVDQPIYGALEVEPIRR
jgi:hypothetical protein